MSSPTHNPVTHEALAHYRGLRVMVTGGFGFIGSNLARTLAELGASVVVLDAMQPNTGANVANLDDLSGKLDVHTVDLRTCAAHPDLFAGVDVIFSLAGNVSHIDSMTDPIRDLGANVHAQIALLEAARAHAPGARIVFASTRQIYGRPLHFPVREDHPLHPVDVNGINKMAAEAYHSLYFSVYGMPTVSLRITNTYGPRMRIKDDRQTFLGIWLRHVVEDRTFEVWGGSQMRDFLFVDDLVHALLHAGWSKDTPGQIFNIGGTPALSLLEVADLITRVAGSGSYTVCEFPAERLRIDIGNYFTDDRAFRSLTGWAPRTSLEDGLAQTIHFYRQRLSAYV